MRCAGYFPALFSQYINRSYRLSPCRVIQRRLFVFSVSEVAPASRLSSTPHSSFLTPNPSLDLDLWIVPRLSAQVLLPRKEVIQPHLPIRLPCYDFTPVIGLTFGSWLLAVTSLTSGAPNSHGVTGGVYKARERIHRGMLIRDY